MARERSDQPLPAAASPTPAARIPRTVAAIHTRPTCVHTNVDATIEQRGADLASTVAPDSAATLAPRWQRQVLIAAGVYNLAWGAWVMARPADLFAVTGATQPTYPELWQCIGMFVFVWGIGYLIAASDPWRHWPIVLVGLLGKLLGPAGFAIALSRDVFPAGWGWTIVTNDLIWVVPFALILRGAMRLHAGPDLAARLRRARRHGDAACALPEPPAQIAERDMSSRAALLARTRPTIDGTPAPPLLVVFLRHSGCVFCREALDLLARDRARISATDTRIVLVHLDDDPKRFEQLVAHHGLGGVELIADPERRLYRAFELRSAPVREHFTPRQWLAGARAWLTTGLMVGAPRGDALQLPGVALIAGGEVKRLHFAASSGERIDVASVVRDGLAA